MRSAARAQVLVRGVGLGWLACVLGCGGAPAPPPSAAIAVAADTHAAHETASRCVPATDGVRISMTPIRVERFVSQEWRLTNTGDVPVTVDAWGGRLFEVRPNEADAAHWLSRCGSVTPDVRTLAPGESARVSEPAGISYAPLGAGRFRFTVALELDDGARGEAQADFELVAMDEHELAAAQATALDGTFAGCAWLPHYAACVIEATPATERAELVGQLGAQGSEVIGSATDALARVGDSSALVSLFESGPAAIRPYVAAGLLELGGGFRLPAVRALREGALEIVVAALREPGPAGTTLLRFAGGLDAPDALRDAWIARLSHEEDVVAVAEVAHQLARRAWTDALSSEHRAVALRRIADARQRHDALRSGELGRFMDALERSISDPGIRQPLPLVDVLDDLRAQRARSATGCGPAPALVRRVLEGCHDAAWMQPRSVTTALRWESSGCSASVRTASESH